MKSTSIAIIIIFVSIYLSGCNNQSQSENTSLTSNPQLTENKNDILQLISNKCFSCHNPDMEIDNRLAPPIFKVREHYFSDSITKVEFVNSIWKFVQNPSEELSIMPGAVRNFSLMPKQNFKEEDVKIIASYLFDNDVSSDSWYNKWDSLNKKSSNGLK